MVHRAQNYRRCVPHQMYSVCKNIWCVDIVAVCMAIWNTILWKIVPSKVRTTVRCFPKDVPQKQLVLQIRTSLWRETKRKSIQNFATPMKCYEAWSSPWSDVFVPKLVIDLMFVQRDMQHIVFGVKISYQCNLLDIEIIEMWVRCEIAIKDSRELFYTNEDWSPMQVIIIL